MKNKTTETRPHSKFVERGFFNTEQFEAAFTEWDLRYREEPERFMSEARRLLKETPETYGEACAPYFFSILKELSARRNKR